MPTPPPRTESPPWLAHVLSVLPGRPARAERIDAVAGGITNHNFRVDAGGRAWFVRLAGADTEVLGIVRSEESASATVAAALGIAPPVVAALTDPPGLVIEFLADARTAEPADLRRPEIIATVSTHLRALHAAPPSRVAFPVFRIIERHAADAAARGVTVPRGYRELAAALVRVESAMASAAPVRCHNDLLTGNFLLGPAAHHDGAQRVWLVDFEYCGMNDRHFDLGNLAQHHDYGDAEVELLAIGYFGVAREHDVARIELMRLASAVREGLWGVVQQSVSDLDFDFAGYAAKHLAQAAERAADPRHTDWLHAATGPDQAPT